MISYESLSRALREDPFEFFVGLGSRRGLKFESYFGLCWLPDLVNDSACLRLEIWGSFILGLGSESAIESSPPQFGYTIKDADFTRLAILHVIMQISYRLVCNHVADDKQFLRNFMFQIVLNDATCNCIQFYS